MKIKNLLAKVLLLFMFTQTILFAGYSIDKSSTTSGASISQWGGSSILKLQASLSGTNLTLTASKQSGTFSSSGTMYFKVGSYESYGANRDTKTVYAGNSSVSSTHNLASYTGYPKSFYTQYGARDINVVKEDIDYWTAFYKDLGVIGIFFDETEGREAQGKRPYYAELTQYIKSQGYDLSIINPGITADQTFVDNYTADIIVSFESYYTSYLSDFKTGNVGKTVESDLTSTALMIHDMDTLANLKQVISEAPADGFDYVYITSGDKGWRTLGVDWDIHVAELLKYERD